MSLDSYLNHTREAASSRDDRWRRQIDWTFQGVAGSNPVNPTETENASADTMSCRGFFVCLDRAGHKLAGIGGQGVRFVPQCTYRSFSMGAQHVRDRRGTSGRTCHRWIGRDGCDSLIDNPSLWPRRGPLGPPRSGSGPTVSVATGSWVGTELTYLVWAPNTGRRRPLGPGASAQRRRARAHLGVPVSVYV